MLCKAFGSQREDFYAAFRRESNGILKPVKKVQRTFLTGKRQRIFWGYIMKKTNRITIGFGALVLVCVVAVAGISASATGGDQTDPLVTLSYLTQVFKPEVLEIVDEQVAANEDALSAKLDAAIDEYSRQMEQALNQGGVSSSSYISVTLAAGQTLVPQAGGEVLLCSGTAKVVSNRASALFDTTAGSSLNQNGALKADHLYIAPLSGIGITASADCVMLVRGDYTVY